MSDLFKTGWKFIDALGLSTPIFVSGLIVVMGFVLRAFRPAHNNSIQSYEPDPLIEKQQEIKIQEHNQAVKAKQIQDYRSMLSEIWEGDKG